MAAAATAGVPVRSTECSDGNRRPPGEDQHGQEIFSKGNQAYLTDDFARRVAQCTLCGACAQGCSTGIDTRKMWLELRQRLSRLGEGPKVYDSIRENLLAKKNVSTFDNEDRLEWAQDLEEPEHLELKEGADVCYFVGCVSSFFPRQPRSPWRSPSC